jgi:hypothetical protein
MEKTIRTKVLGYLKKGKSIHQHSIDSSMYRYYVFMAYNMGTFKWKLLTWMNRFELEGCCWPHFVPIVKYPIRK